jgi:hypothetical protein
MVLGWPELPNRWARQKGVLLKGMHCTSIVAPYGRTLVRIYANRLDQSGMSLDLTDLDTGVMLPVRCHVELDSMTIAAPGRWELTWNLRAP